MFFLKIERQQVAQKSDSKLVAEPILHAWVAQKPRIVSRLEPEVLVEKRILVPLSKKKAGM